MHIHFKIFQSNQFRFFQSSQQRWETVFQRATDFASRLEARQLISISHSCDGGEAVAVVWYWDRGRRKSM